LEGAGGFFDLREAMYCVLNRVDEAKELLKILKNKGDIVLKTGKHSEMLYGTAGYLYTLYFMSENVPNNVCNEIDWNVEEEILRCINKLFEDGNDGSPYLQYYFDGVLYLGAAHGISGIVYMMLHRHDLFNENQTAIIKSTIDWIASCRDEHGNYCWTSKKDYLTTHWCHGSPGIVYLFTKAHSIFHEEKYLNFAKEAANNVWELGVLKKSISICHGICGNAYSFLHMYNYTGEQKYLYWAYTFASFSIDERVTKKMKPDRPNSLFEGKAGQVCFYTDLLNPNTSMFPCFELK